MLKFEEDAPLDVSKPCSVGELGRYFKQSISARWIDSYLCALFVKTAGNEKSILCMFVMQIYDSVCQFQRSLTIQFIIEINSSRQPSCIS